MTDSDMTTRPGSSPGEWAILASRLCVEEVNRGYEASWTEYVCYIWQGDRLVLAWADRGYPYGVAAGTPCGELVVEDLCLKLALPPVALCPGDPLPEWAENYRQQIETKLLAGPQ